VRNIHLLEVLLDGLKVNGRLPGLILYQIQYIQPNKIQVEDILLLVAKAAHII